MRIDEQQQLHNQMEKNKNLSLQSSDDDRVESERHHLLQQQNQYQTESREEDQQHRQNQHDHQKKKHLELKVKTIDILEKRKDGFESFKTNEEEKKQDEFNKDKKYHHEQNHEEDSKNKNNYYKEENMNIKEQHCNKTAGEKHQRGHNNIEYDDCHIHDNLNMKPIDKNDPHDHNDPDCHMLAKMKSDENFHHYATRETSSCLGRGKPMKSVNGKRNSKNTSSSLLPSNIINQEVNMISAPLKHSDGSLKLKVHNKREKGKDTDTQRGLSGVKKGDPMWQPNGELFFSSPGENSQPHPPHARRPFHPISSVENTSTIKKESYNRCSHSNFTSEDVSTSMVPSNDSSSHWLPHQTRTKNKINDHSTSSIAGSSSFSDMVKRNSSSPCVPYDAPPHNDITMMTKFQRRQYLSGKNGDPNTAIEENKQDKYSGVRSPLTTSIGEHKCEPRHQKNREESRHSSLSQVFLFQSPLVDDYCSPSFVLGQGDDKSNQDHNIEAKGGNSSENPSIVNGTNVNYVLNNGKSTDTGRPAAKSNKFSSVNDGKAATGNAGVNNSAILLTRDDIYSSSEHIINKKRRTSKLLTHEHGNGSMDNGYSNKMIKQNKKQGADIEIGLTSKTTSSSYSNSSRAAQVGTELVDFAQEKNEEKESATTSTSRPNNVTTKIDQQRTDTLNSSSINNSHQSSFGLETGVIGCQFIDEDINCGGCGFVFLDLSTNDSAKDYLNRYLGTPGVRVVYESDLKGTKSRKTTKRKSKDSSKRKNDSSSSQFSFQQKTHESNNKKACYKARGRFLDVSVNLGSHQSSASAAAAVDIANVLFWGEDNIKPLYILSLNEIEAALKAVGINDIKLTSERFREKFNEQQKSIFEYYIESALSSIGGKDDDIASTLCSLGKYQNVKNTQSKQSSKKKGKSQKKNVKTSEKPSDLQYEGQHVVYEVNNDGYFSWRRISENT